MVGAAPARTRAPGRRRAVAWRRLAAAVGTALVLTAPLPARASERSESARRGAEYLAEHQAADGTFFGDDAPHRVAEALVALVAGGIEGEPVARALSAIAAGGPEAADTAGEAGLLVMGIVAGGEDPRDFRGEDYVEHLESFYDETVGMYHLQMFQNALALLGVVAAGEPIPDEAIRFLRLNRCADGGIGIQAPCGGGGGHVDVTALVLNALARAGMPPSDSLRSGARAFLVAAQNGEGGFGDTKGKPTNANSTGLALTAIAALGESATETPWRRPDGDPVERLLALQQDDGRFRLSAAAEGDPFIATRQAVPGIAGRAHPVGPNGSSPGPPPGNPPAGDPIPSGVPGVETLPTVSATPTLGPVQTPVVSPAATLTGAAAPGPPAPLIAVGAARKAGGGRSFAPFLGAAAALAVTAGTLLMRIRQASRSHR